MNSYPVLERMLQDMNTQSELYRPTAFWERALTSLVTGLKEGGIENFRALPQSLSFFVPTYAFPLHLMEKERLQPVIDTLHSLETPCKRSTLRVKNFLSGQQLAMADYRVQAASDIDCPPFTNAISESTTGNPLEQFEFDGRRFSRSFLNYLLGINFLKKHVKNQQIENVLEIGGGFGTLGEILLGDNRNNCFYIDVDIPPLSFVSAYYLGHVFGKEHIGSYEELRSSDLLEIEKLKKHYKAACLCSWQLPKLSGKIDLFVNFISFQEMEPFVVENYCNHILRLEPEFVLLRNLKEGKQKKTDSRPQGVETPILGTDYDTFLPGYNLIDTDTTIFGFLTEDGFHSELRLYKKE